MASEAPIQYLSTSGDPFDYDTDLVAAMTSYSRIMYIHTKKQMDAAIRASQLRKGDATVDPPAHLTKERAWTAQAQAQA